MFSTAFLDIPPLASAAGTVSLPGSKSISNRVLLLAALAGGTTVVHDLLDSDDTRVMLDALRALGCGVRHDGAALEITGLGGRAPAVPARLFLGNAGTAMRPLTAALAVIGGDFELSGVPRMHERPIGDLVDALRQLGCRIDYLGTEGYPPLRIGRPQLRLDAPIQVRGDVSSQFLTALLMALPLVATRDVVIEVVGELISKPYIEITLKLLQRFGIAVQRDGWQRFTIPAGSAYRSPGSIHVEADASSASYFVALGAIAADAAAPLRVRGVGLDSIQGDIRFVEAARLMGAKVEGEPNGLSISRGRWPLKAVDLDCNHIPDAAMTLAVMALYADGTTTLRNIASWRVKETDRLAAMAIELAKLGAQVEEGQDFLKVTPPPAWKPAAIHVLLAGRLQSGRPAGSHPRSEVRGQDLPGVFRDAVLGGTDRFRAAGSGAVYRWAHGFRQGHAGRRTGAPAGLPLSRLRRPVPGHGAGRPAGRPGAHAAARSRDRQAGAEPAGAVLPWQGSAGRRRRQRGDPHRRGRHERIDGLGPAGRPRRPAFAAAQLPPLARPGGRRPRHGHRHLPGRPGQGVPHRKRRPASRAAL
jgi:3-phosphoshikimate 1-carboxyvinyltransferase